MENAKLSEDHLHSFSPPIYFEVQECFVGMYV